MAVAIDPWSGVKEEIERAAQNDALSADARIAKLRVYRGDLNDWLGRLDSYIGDLELVREGREPAYREQVQEMREDANVRGLLLERGLATPEELDELGMLSHEDIAKLDEEGLLDAWVAERLVEAFGTDAVGSFLHHAWEEIKHPRGGGGKFRDVLGRHVAPKGRKGATVPLRKPPRTRPHTPGKPVDETGIPGEGVRQRADVVVTSDPEEAVRALAAGKHVELQEHEQVSTMLDKLNAYVKEMAAKGEDAPNLDLCRVTVKGTSLFCVEGKGIPRAQMPQLLGKPLPDTKADAMPRNSKGEVDLTPHFVAHLVDKGVEIKRTRMLVSHMKATQNELNGVKVAGIFNYLSGGGKIESEPYLVDQTGYVVDGHHRWAAEIGVDFTDSKPDWETAVDQIDLPILELLKESNAFALEWGIPQAGFAAGVPKPVAEAAQVMLWKLALGYEFDEQERQLAEAVLREEGVEDEYLGSEREVRESIDAYIEGLHPRNRLGMWIEKLGRAMPSRRAPISAWPEKGAKAHEVLGSAESTWEKHSVVIPSINNARVYSPERKVLHDQIIDTLLRKRKLVPVTSDDGSPKLDHRGEPKYELHPDPDGDPLRTVGERPRVLFVAGGTASGKSSAMGLEENAMVVPPDAVNIDPDEIKAMLPEYVEMIGSGDKYAAVGVHLESGQIARRLLNEAMRRGLNISRDGTGDSPGMKFAKEISKMSAAGYEVHVFYVNAPTDVAVERAERRARETGRWVPESQIREIHKNVSARFTQHVLPLVREGTISKLSMYQTEGDPVPIAEGGGGSFQVLDQRLYDRFVAKRNE